MASVATSNIIAITRSVLAGQGTGLQIGGAPIAAFRINAGQVPGDTAVLTPPAEFGNIRAVIGPVAHNLPTTLNGASNITVTMTSIGATGTTIPAVDVWLVGSPAS